MARPGFDNHRYTVLRLNISIVTTSFIFSLPIQMLSRIFYIGSHQLLGLGHDGIVPAIHEPSLDLARVNPALH